MRKRTDTFAQRGNAHAIVVDGCYRAYPGSAEDIKIAAINNDACSTLQSNRWIIERLRPRRARLPAYQDNNVRFAGGLLPIRKARNDRGYRLTPGVTSALCRSNSVNRGSASSKLNDPVGMIHKAARDRSIIIVMSLHAPKKMALWPAINMTENAMPTIVAMSFKRSENKFLRASEKIIEGGFCQRSASNVLQNERNRSLPELKGARSLST